MSEEDRKAVIRSMLLLELNSVFTNAYSHFSHYGDDEDRAYLRDMIALLKDCLKRESTEPKSDII